LEAACFQRLPFADFYSDLCLGPANGEKECSPNVKHALFNAGMVEVCGFPTFRGDAAKGWGTPRKQIPLRGMTERKRTKTKRSFAALWRTRAVVEITESLCVPAPFVVKLRKGGARGLFFWRETGELFRELPLQNARTTSYSLEPHG
jgi:hypothetical protein